MEPLDFSNPYDEKLRRKKHKKKNKQISDNNDNEEDPVDEPINNSFLFRAGTENEKKPQFKKEEFIQDTNPNPNKLKLEPLPDIRNESKETFEFKNLLPVLPVSIKPVDPIIYEPEIQVAKSKEITEIKKDENNKVKEPMKKQNIPKKVLFLSIAVGVLGILVIILLILTIVFGVRSANLSSTNSTSATTTTCSYGFSGPNCSDQCGLQSYTQNVRIVGGSDAVSHSWPSIVYIMFKYKLDNIESGNTFQYQFSKTCSGTLINRNTVLTSAQCYVERVTFNSSSGASYDEPVTVNSYYPTYESMYTVYLGYNDISEVFSGTTTYPGRKVSVKNFFRHPNYDSTELLNDIALIKLKSSVSLDSYLQISCLPSSSNYPTKTNIDAWTAGWGDLGENSVLVSFNLKNLKVTLYPETECAGVLTGLNKDWSKQLCAGDKSGGKGICKGDEGGPLFVKDSVNGAVRYILVGIASQYEGCARANLPAVFTKVSPYLAWINLYA